MTEQFAQNIRRLIFRMIHTAGGGHIAPALSCADILAVLYQEVLQISPDFPDAPERDRFILSKGHASAALFATLALKGFFPQEWLENYCRFDSPLGGHPDMHKVPGVEASTGSLGHGLPFGVGVAFANRRTYPAQRVWVLLGDGECQEGSIWESALFAAHHNLENLNVIVDANGLQAMGAVSEIMGLGSLVSKWSAFGWESCEVDGHDHEALRRTFSESSRQKGRPKAIIARTIKGKGISFMENKPLWHYRQTSEEETKRAIMEIEAGGER